MGMLVAKHYPTILLGKTADHTYVECGTGARGWSCWGGKTGGTFLRSGSGSTNQADAIAGPSERAGITCYLINGVCHQAANRILFPAGIFVTGARGYGVSSAIFGPYGRPTGPAGRCPAPFNRHAGVTGDLPACVPPPAAAAGPAVGHSTQEETYFNSVSRAYSQIGLFGLGDEDQLVDFMVRLFDYQIDYRLGNQLDDQRHAQLRDLRTSAEESRIELETDFANGIPVIEFVVRADLQVIQFQKDATEILTEQEYYDLFDLRKGEVVALADPAIVETAYPQQATIIRP